MNQRLRHRAGGTFGAAALLAIPSVFLVALLGLDGGLPVSATETEPPAAGPEATPGEQPAFDFPAAPLPATPAPAADPEEVVPERAPADPSGVPPVPSAISEIMNRDRYDYRSLGRRDPFRSLVSGEFLRGQGTELIDVGDMKLVGVLWGQGDRYALVEDSRGFGYILRVGDPVRNGVVIDIDSESITVEHTMFGQTEIVTVPLNRREGEGHE